MLYSLFHIHSICHDTAITTGFKTWHVLLLLTICVTLSDENIYKYMMHVFKCIYALSCVVTRLAKMVVVMYRVNFMLCMGEQVCTEFL